MARIVDTGQNTLASPRWAGDYGSPELGLMRGPLRLDASAFASMTYTVTLTANALAAATSIAVSALPVAIPAGTVLDFTGTGKLAKTSANAAAGATSISVVALDAALSSGDTAPYTVTDAAPVTVPSGTIVGRTAAEAVSHTNFGPAGASDTEVYIVYFEVYDASVNPDFVGYRPYAGRVVKTNYLPGYADVASGVKTLLAARYLLVEGED